MKIKSIKLNAILNVIKQLCAIIFPLVTIPYVTRILHATNYGKVNFSSSIISYFSLIAQLGIVSYAIREGAKLRDDKRKIEQFSNEVFSINLITTIIAYILLGLAILISSKLQDYYLLLIIQSTVIIFTTLGADWVNNIYEDFLYITIRSIAVQAISLILMFVLVHDEDDYIVYAVVTVCAQIGVNILNVFYIRKYLHIKPTIHLRIKNHIKPILYLFFNNVAMTIYINSDITMLGFMVNDAAVGIYNIATKIYMVIKHIINAIVTVTLPRLSAYVENEDKRPYHNLLERVFESIITVLFPAITGLLILSKPIILLLSDIEYIQAVKVLQILSISLIFAVFGGFFTICILVPNRMDKALLIATSIAAGINIILNIFLIPLWSYNGAAITTAIAELFVLIITRHYAKKIYDIKCSLRTIISVLIGCFIILFICISINYLFQSNLVIVTLSVLLSCLAYGLIMYWLKNPLVCGVVNNLINKMKKY